MDPAARASYSSCGRCCCHYYFSRYVIGTSWKQPKSNDDHDFMQIIERQKPKKLLMSRRLWWVVLVAWWWLALLVGPLKPNTLSLSLDQKKTSLLTHFAPSLSVSLLSTYLVFGWIMTKKSVYVSMNEQSSTWKYEWSKNGINFEYRTWIAMFLSKQLILHNLPSSSTGFHFTSHSTA